MPLLRSEPPNLDPIHLSEVVEFSRSLMELSDNSEFEFALSTDKDLLRPIVEYLMRYGIATDEDIEDAIFSSDHNVFLDAIMELKERYGVSRPFVLARRMGRPLPFELNSDTVESESYPSGHAASSRFAAHLLSDVFLRGHPDADRHRGEIFMLANRIAWGRVLLGVHSIQDIREGKRLADVYFIGRDL